MNDILPEDFEFFTYDFGNNNPYYSPEKCGLEIVCQVELSEPSYSFDTRVVWKAQNGKLYTAHDSGCSCPTPFEYFHKLGDLTLLDRNTLLLLKDELKQHIDYVTPEKAQDFLYKIRDAMK